MDVNFNYAISSGDTDRERFDLKATVGDRYNDRSSYVWETFFIASFTQMDVHDIVNAVASLIKGASITFHDYLHVRIIGDNLSVLLKLNYCANMPFEKKDRSAVIYFYSTPENIEPVYKILHSKYANNSDPMITWFYERDDKKLESKDFYISPETTFYPEFYPYLGDVDKYCEDFDKSTSNILILIGPPGTGKTSFLKHFLRHTKNNAITTYDQNVMTTDSLYVGFLNSFSKYLILEDSDVLLLSRERDDNRVMSKILNASDGLVSTNKKFIFTANLANDSQIDEALLRPGRCFDVKHFRALTQAEADTVARKLDKNLPDKDEYSLAEIFNGNGIKPKQSFGF